MNGKQNRTSLKVINEFLSEASETVESVNNNLMKIDSALKDGDTDPQIVNDVFRGWHTLKGLASTFGVEVLTHLAHDEESLLDNIRLGRVELSPQILDELFERVDIVNRILAAIREREDLRAADSIDISLQSAGLKSESPPALVAFQDDQQLDVDIRNVVSSDVLEVLTEFEEHRLQANLRQGHALYKIRTGFSLQSIDKELDAVKQCLKPVGEIITYLPSTESSDPDILDIDVILALKESVDDLHEALANTKVTLDLLVPKQAPHRTTSPTIMPRPASDYQDHMIDIPPDGEELTAKSSTDPSIAKSATIIPKLDKKPISLRSVNQSVRVDITKLDNLMNSVGELNIVRTAIAKMSDELRSVEGKRDLALELHRIVRGFERRLAEMRESILEFRMVPMGQLFDRLSRITRNVSRSLGKEIQFMVSGSDTEVDKLIIEELSDPLMHIIRNSIDHGIENVEDRRAVGKPDVGIIALTAYQKGNHVLIQVEDDGAGINTKGIITAAIKRGILTKDQAESLSERETLNLIFLPGITTAETATEISGRGVGMDVVKTNISILGGVVEIQSELGTGTKFIITMPVTLAIIPAFFISVDGHTYSLPLNNVTGALPLQQSDVKKVLNTETITLRGKTLPLCRLDAFFGKPRPGPIPENSKVIAITMGHRRLGLVVDKLFGQQAVIVKPLGASLRHIDCFSGVTGIGDQRFSLVIDTVKIIDEFFDAEDDQFFQAAGE